jgi:hypothetical protein
MYKTVYEQKVTRQREEHSQSLRTRKDTYLFKEQEQQIELGQNSVKI